MNLSDRFKAGIEALVRRIVSRYDYAIPWACKVVSQNGDGTLELQPDSALMPGLSNVPIRYGAPGVKATVGAGSRCIVEFEDADPSKPVVTAWDVSSPLVVLQFGGGTLPVARLGDLVQGGGPGTIVTLVPITGVGVPPNNAIAAGVPCMISFSPIPPTPLVADPLYSVITTGADKVQS